MNKKFKKMILFLIIIIDLLIIFFIINIFIKIYRNNNNYIADVYASNMITIYENKYIACEAIKDLYISTYEIDLSNNKVEKKYDSSISSTNVTFDISKSNLNKIIKLIKKCKNTTLYDINSFYKVSENSFQKNTFDYYSIILNDTVYYILSDKNIQTLEDSLDDSLLEKRSYMNKIKNTDPDINIYTRSHAIITDVGSGYSYEIYLDNQILLLKDNNYRGVYIASGMSGESYDLYNIYKLSNSSIEEIKKIIENHKYSEDTQNFTESTETNDENSNDFSAFFEYDYVLSYNNKTFKITKDEDDFKTLSEIIQKTIE